jgi:hypothetical protein
LCNGRRTLRDGGRRKMVEQVQLISFERGTVTGLGLDCVFLFFLTLGLVVFVSLTQKLLNINKTYLFFKKINWNKIIYMAGEIII